MRVGRRELRQLCTDPFVPPAINRHARLRIRCDVSDVHDVAKSARSNVVVAQQRRGPRIDQRRLGAAILQQIRDQIGRRQCVDENRNESRANRTEDGGRVLRPVVEQHQHATAARESHRQ